MTWNAEQEDPINKKKEDIIRCGECKFYTGTYCHHKMQYGLSVTESDYCSKGERKNG